VTPSFGFSAAFSGGPIEAACAARRRTRRRGFSAAFSGGPIEAGDGLAEAFGATNFPLLLAAAPLKPLKRRGLKCQTERIFRCF